MHRSRHVLLCIAAILVAQVAQAAEVEGKVLRENWYESRAETGKLGHMHFLAREVERDGKRLIRTTIRDEMSYLRSGDPYSDSQEEATLETPTGEIVELIYGVTLSKKQRLRLHGVVQGDQLKITVLDEHGQPTKFTQVIPWDRNALGLYAQDRFFEGKTLKAGDVLTFKSFIVYANRVLPTTCTMKGVEFTPFKKVGHELVRVEASFPKDAYLAPTTLWLDSTGRIVKLEEEDGTLFGSMWRELTTKDVATAPFKPRVRDKEAPVLVNKPITIRRNRPVELRVRVSLEGDDQPRTLFVEDGRQKIVDADTKAVELLLKAKPEAHGASKAEPEYLASNFFIRSDDPLVQKLAKEAIGEATEPREQARLIKRWVRTKVRGNYEIPFATADEVARSLEGDCSEMGILVAAMARAVGVPSRVAFGIVYDSENRGFGGHLWSEVFLDGQWERLDATGVTDVLNAAYIKIATYSLKDLLNPDELVAVRRAFTGTMKVEVLEAK